MTNCSGNKEERLAVLVSGESCPEGHILAGITMEEGHGTGRDIAESVLKALESNYLDKHAFGAMIFDTTSKNSGRIKGGAKILESLLGQKLVWLGCGHHVMEILISAAWAHIFGSKKSKDNEECKNFKTEWDNVDKDSVFR